MLLPFIDNIFTAIKDKARQTFGKQLNVESNIIRTNIDSSDQRQAEIEMQKAAAAGARSDIGLDQWNTIVGSGTSNDDYVQKYMQGQQGRDFQNPNSISPNMMMYGIIAIIGFMVLVVVVMMGKKPASLPQTPIQTHFTTKSKR